MNKQVKLVLLSMATLGLVACGNGDKKAEETTTVVDETTIVEETTVGTKSLAEEEVQPQSTYTIKAPSIDDKGRDVYTMVGADMDDDGYYIQHYIKVNEDGKIVVSGFTMLKDEGDTQLNKADDDEDFKALVDELNTYLVDKQNVDTLMDDFNEWLTDDAKFKLLNEFQSTSSFLVVEAQGGNPGQELTEESDEETVEESGEESETTEEATEG